METNTRSADVTSAGEAIRELCANMKSVYSIDRKCFASDAIKRGLRNADGSGVMAGVTKIGSVQGYYLVDMVKTPVEGRLFYRGINLADILAGRPAGSACGYEEVAYLLLFGSLPTQERFDAFRAILAGAHALPKGFFEDMILKAPSRDVMNKLERSVLAMYSYDDTPDCTDLGNVARQSIELIGRFPTVVAHAYAVKRHIFDGDSLYIHNPDPSLSVSQNFLRMLRKDKSYTHEEAQLLDLMMILHAEHSSNNSTFVCRAISSSGTDTYSAIGGAIGSLKGPLHGGANAKVMEMLGYLSQAVDEPTDAAVQDFLAKLLRGEAGDRSGKIYGLGHAVYTLSDPRAQAVKKYARAIADKNGFSRDFDLLETVERVGIPMLMERSGRSLPMCANVDLYSGLIYKTLGTPMDLYTPIFAIARVAGWCAHRLEELLSARRIIRPAYRSSMKWTDYVPIDER